jgi:large subunit ribosomal protein L24
MPKVHVKKGDTVIVISGEDKGKKGKVLKVMPNEKKILVEGINIVTKHKKPNGQAQQGGIIHEEAPIYSSKVLLYCNTCGKGVRYGRKILDNGQKVRYCKVCGENID